MSDERKVIMGRNIEINLARMGLNKTDLSKRLKIPMQTISNWCCGHTYPRIDKIELMADFFGIKVTDLIDKQTQVIETTPKYNWIDTIYQLDTEDAELVKSFVDNLLKREKYTKKQKAI